jgi:hypothetical protein
MVCTCCEDSDCRCCHECPVHGGLPVGHSVEYDVKNDKIKVTPIFAEKFYKPAPKKLWQRFLQWVMVLIVCLILWYGILLLLASCVGAAVAETPRIGNLTLPTHWWVFVQQAAAEEGVDPYLVAAVMAIESRYDRFAVNKRCQSYGLMQLQIDVARGLGIENPFDAEMNIRGGAKILGRLMRQYGGNVKRVLKKYNPEDTGAYSREVIKAWRQAKKS